MKNALSIYENRNIDHANFYYDNPQPKGSGIGIYIFMGLFALVTLVGGAGYWAFSAKLNGAVIAPASFVVESNRKTVQHLEGGIVKDLLVREGDYVEADQVLLRMDATGDEVNVDVLGSQLSELYVRRARLTSELAQDKVFEFDAEKHPVVGNLAPEERNKLIAVQKALFSEQLEARESEAKVVAQRISRFEEEVAGLAEQRAANERQLVIIDKEIETFEDLLRRQLTAVSRVSAIRRERERLLGSDAELATSQARALNQIDELKLTVLGEKRLRREAIATELAQIETQISSISPQYFGARQKLKRVAEVAPVSGRVVNMKVYTNGGVIRPGDPILDIVPESDELVIEARIATSDIEKLFVGQDTRVRLSGFDLAEVPEADGEITSLSADRLTDERTGANYYVARVRLREQQSAQIKNLEFVPGMPADVFINTGERTAFSYLMQPLNDRLARTFVQ